MKRRPRWAEIRIQGAASGETVISGATEIEFNRVAASQSVDGAPAAARGQLWLAKLPPFSPQEAIGFALPVRPLAGELFLGETRQPVAHWPNTGYAQLGRAPGVPADDKRSFQLPDAPPALSSAGPDLRAAGYWFHDWAYQSHPVVADGGPGFVLAGDGSNYGIKAGQRVRLENGLPLLDQPGEWASQARSGDLYWWAPRAAAAGPTPLVAEWSTVQTALRLKGSRNVTLRGLVFEKFRGEALVVADSSQVLFDAVHLRWVGNRGLVVSGGQAVGIRNSTVEDIGMAAIVLAGGNRTSLQASGHFAEGNTVRRFAHHNKTYQPGVALNGVGQRVVGNVISDAPHAAVLFSGNDHQIADNEIHHVTQETDDAGAIYTGRDYTAQGTVIEGNFIHDLQARQSGRGVVGVYLDDQASGTTVRNNIFARVSIAVVVGGGRDNRIEDNLFYRAPQSIVVDGRGVTWQKKQTADASWGLLKGLAAAPFDSPAWRARYPQLANIRQDGFGRPVNNQITDNVFVSSGPALIREEAKPWVRATGSQERAEADMVAPRNGEDRSKRSDFRLR